jgi:hypothetical protein
LLDPAMNRTMLDPVKPGHSMGFDLGGAGRNLYFDKGGDTEGFAGQIVAYAYRGDGVAILTNSANGNALASDLVRSVAAAYHWPDFHSESRNAIAVDKAVWRRIVGNYTYGTKGAFSIRVENDHLSIESPGEPAERLYAQSPSEWFTLSDDTIYVFDTVAGDTAMSGHIDSDGDNFSFHRVSMKPQ